MTIIHVNTPIIAYPRIIPITTQTALAIEIAKFTKKKILEPQILQVDQGLTVDGFMLNAPIYGFRDYLLIRGDQNNWAGLTYAHGQTIRSTKDNCGVGIITLGGTTTAITVVGSTSNPDFSALTTNHDLIVTNTAGAVERIGVASGSGNTINLDSAFTGSIAGSGASICVAPNRKISTSGVASFRANAPCALKFQGFEFTSVAGYNVFDLGDADGQCPYGEVQLALENCFIASSGDAYCLNATAKTRVKIAPDVTFSGINGINLNNQSAVYANTGFTIQNMAGYGVHANNGAYLEAQYILALWQTVFPVILANRSKIIAKNLVGVKIDCDIYGAIDGNYNSNVDVNAVNIDLINANTKGIRSIYGSKIFAHNSIVDGVDTTGVAVAYSADAQSLLLAHGSAAKNVATGYNAYINSYIRATNTLANIDNVGTNYSPSSNLVEGNYGSWIYRS